MCTSQIQLVGNLVTYQVCGLDLNLDLRSQVASDFSPLNFNNTPLPLLFIF